MVVRDVPFVFMFDWDLENNGGEKFFSFFNICLMLYNFLVCHISYTDFFSHVVFCPHHVHPLSSKTFFLLESKQNSSISTAVLNAIELCLFSFLNWALHHKIPYVMVFPV